MAAQSPEAAQWSRRAFAAVLLQLIVCQSTLGRPGPEPECRLEETCLDEGDDQASKERGRKEIADMPVRELRRQITTCGLTCRGCVERSELEQKALEALHLSRAGLCAKASAQAKEPAATPKTKKNALASSKRHKRSRGNLKMQLLPYNKEELSKADLSDLRRLIRHRDLSDRDCFERRELLKRAEEALLKAKPLPLPGPIKRSGHVAHVLTPKGLRKGQNLPLLFVLHGAGKTDEGLRQTVVQFSKVASRRKCLVVVLGSSGSTWDLMDYIKHGTFSKDTEFLASVLDDVSRDYFVDRQRVALLGFSDGASYGITLAVNNPKVFQAVMAWSAGYFHTDGSSSWPAGSSLPNILHGHGQEDTLFDFWKVALPMRQRLRDSGFPVKAHTIKAAGHGTPPEFVDAALDWWMTLAR